MLRYLAGVTATNRAFRLTGIALFLAASILSVHAAWWNPFSARVPTNQTLRAGSSAPPKGVALEELFARVPPLRHDATGRWPMIAWKPFLRSATDASYEKGIALSPGEYRELGRRGLTQAIRFDRNMIPMALALQKAGCRVIVVQGEGGAGPGAEAPDASHRLDDGFQPRGATSPCPMLLEGWRNHADKTRELLRTFKARGVTLDAVWLDSETQPLSSEDQWDQARHCSRCRELFPESVLATPAAYRAFIGPFRQDLQSAYLAAPVREAYPKCLVANWGVVYATPEIPTSGYWGNVAYSPRSAGLFTALNPVAYGNDTIYGDYWRSAWPDPERTPLDQEHMDRLYTHVMLAQFSQNAAIAQKWAPEKSSVPWVCRYCPDTGNSRVPALSRPRYREILRHLWLRGADTMQIFNPYREAQPEAALDEIADAVQVYDEMLAHREFLERGVILNTEIPATAGEAAIWSGLRLPDRALVRAFSPGSAPVAATVQPWPGGPVFTLAAPPEGDTYMLSTNGTQTRLPAE